MQNLFLATAAAAEAPVEPGMLGMLVQLSPIVLIFVVFYFMMLRPQKKREKQIQDMRSKIEVGDEIVTSGGVVGRVVSIKDETVVIESGSDRSKIRIMRWAVQTNNTIHDDTPSA